MLRFVAEIMYTNDTLKILMIANPGPYKSKLKPNPPSLGQVAFAESSRPVDIPERFLLAQTRGS